MNKVFSEGLDQHHEYGSLSPCPLDPGWDWVPDLISRAETPVQISGRAGRAFRSTLTAPSSPQRKGTPGTQREVCGGVVIRSPPCRFCRESLLQAGCDPRLPGQQGVLRSSCCLVRYAGRTSAVYSRTEWEACRVVPHRRRDSSCHTQEAGVVLSHRWQWLWGIRRGWW